MECWDLLDKNFVQTSMSNVLECFKVQNNVQSKRKSQAKYDIGMYDFDLFKDTCDGKGKSHKIQCEMPARIL